MQRYKRGTFAAALPRSWHYCADNLYEAAVNPGYADMVKSALQGYRGLLETADPATVRWFRLVELALLTIGELEGFGSIHDNPPSLWAPWLRSLPPSTALRNALYSGNAAADANRVFEVLAASLHNDLAPYLSSYCPPLESKVTFLETMRWICGALLDRAWDTSLLDQHMWSDLSVGVPIGFDFASHSGNPNAAIVMPDPATQPHHLILLQGACVFTGVSAIPETHVPYIFLRAERTIRAGEDITIDYGLRSAEEAKRSHGFDLLPGEESKVPQSSSTIVTIPWDDVAESTVVPGE